MVAINVECKNIHLLKSEICKISLLNDRFLEISKVVEITVKRHEDYEYRVITNIQEQKKIVEDEDYVNGLEQHDLDDK